MKISRRAMLASAAAAAIAPVVVKEPLRYNAAGLARVQLRATEAIHETVHPILNPENAAALDIVRAWRRETLAAVAALHA
jgi:hypothetical protein